MKISIFIIISLFFVSFSANAQFETTSDSSNSQTVTKAPKTKPQPKPLKDKIVVGGGLDLRFGDITVIGVTPLIGYTVTDNLIVGSIFTYRYFSDNRPAVNYSTSTYGIAPFARYNIFKGLFAHVEYEMLYGEYYYNDGSRWLNSLLVGGGYGTQIGRAGFAGIYVLWNVTPDENYPIYEAPVVRMSFGVGF